MSVGRVDSLENGEWAATAFSSASVEVGVTFKCSLHDIMPGLKKGASTTTQGYTALDYGFCCRPTGIMEVYELGVWKYTHTTAYTTDSVLELRLTKDGFVKYIIDGRLAYTSTTAIGTSESVHFAVAFLTESAYVKDIVQDNVSNIF